MNCVTRVRDEELVYILHHIGRLELDEGVFEVALEIDPKKEDPIKVLQDIEGGDSESTW